MHVTDERETIRSLLTATLREDLGEAGDVTSCSIFSDTDTAQAVIRSKSEGILSGAYLIAPLFSSLDPSLHVECLLSDGASLKQGTEICRISGSIKAILAGERSALNLLQRLSGIATQTAHLVSLIAHTPARLLDTRKTTPLLRVVEKKAVLAGGGCNHRFGLFDMILIKDTHVRAAGGVRAAIVKAQAYRLKRPQLRIEAEVQSIDEFNEALKAKPDRIMLDNMPCRDMVRCVDLRNKKESAVQLEASGNVAADTIRDIAETGVDFISVGALTHSVKALDIHLVIT